MGYAHVIVHGHLENPLPIVTKSRMDGLDGIAIDELRIFLTVAEEKGLYLMEEFLYVYGVLCQPDQGGQ